LGEWREVGLLAWFALLSTRQTQSPAPCRQWDYIVFGKGSFQKPTNRVVAAHALRRAVANTLPSRADLISPKSVTH